MKKRNRIGIFILLLFLTTSVFSQHEDYDKEWKRIQELIDEEDRPQSAIEEIDRVLEKATKVTNDVQVVKSLIFKNKLKKKISRDNYGSLLPDLESRIGQTGDACTKALIHSMLAEAYLDYYDSRQYYIRKNESDTVPLLLNDWPATVFFDTLLYHVKLSVAEKQLLQKRKVSYYKDILEEGNDKVRYPALYDFLMKRALNITAQTAKFQLYADSHTLPLTPQELTLPANRYVALPIDSVSCGELAVFAYFKDYLSDLLNRNRTATIILIELEKLNFMKGCGLLSEQEAFEVLLQLERTYRNSPDNSEIINEMAENYARVHPDRNSFEIEKATWQWLRKGLERYPSSYGARKLELLLKRLERPLLSLKGRETLHPDEEQVVSIIHKNTEPGPFVFTLYKQIDGQYRKMKSYSFRLKSKTTYSPDTLRLNIGRQEPGRYVIGTCNEEEINENPDEDRFYFKVSALMYYSRRSGMHEEEIFVLDYKSGEPRKGAAVTFYKEIKDTIQVLDEATTDEMGIARLHLFEEQSGYYTVSLDKDTCMEPERLYYSKYDWSESGKREKRPEEQLNVFSDRSIYRPGQPLFYKVILCDSLGYVKENVECTVGLNDANGQIIEFQKQTTNEFGSIAGQFTLPKSGLPGDYHLFVYSKEAFNKYFFKVEEYKRPTFRITFDPSTVSDSLDKEVRIKAYARSFSGAAVSGAKVKYTVRREHFSFRPLGQSRSRLIREGETRTDDDGSFETVFQAESDKEDTRKGMRNYRFRITAVVTDINGETREESHTVGIGEKPIGVEIEIKDREDKFRLKDLRINATNLKEESLSLRGIYSLYRLSEQGVRTEIGGDSLITGVHREMPVVWRNQPSGRYLLTIILWDDKGREIKESKEFILFGYADSRPPINTNEWIVEKNTSFAATVPAEVLFGVTDTVYVLYQLTDGYRIFERKMMKMSNECRMFTVPYQEEYGDHIYMTFTFVRDGKLYNSPVSLLKSKEEPERDLILKISSFRDRLLPGQKEEWTVSVEDKRGVPVACEVLASMYDVSLDQIWRGASWDFYLAPQPTTYASTLSYRKPYLFDRWKNISRRVFSPYVRRPDLGMSVLPPPSVLFPEVPRFDQLNWFGYIYNHPEMYIYSLAEKKKLLKGWGVEYENVYSDNEHYGVDIADLQDHKVIVMQDEKAGWGRPEASIDSKPSIRKNFRETAFFYPQLQTRVGETNVSFTVPESNTTWRFRVLAHDFQGRFGSLQRVVTTSKPLMVTPHLPRFLRTGDKAVLSAKITNLSSDLQSGVITIEFFNPETEEVIDLGTENREQEFVVRENASVSVRWDVHISDNPEPVGCRIVARNKNFSDGEQHVLPILPTKVLVTESLPIAVRSKGKKTFVMDKLYSRSDQKDNYKLILEYSDNPVIPVIKALSSLSDSFGEDVISWFGRYYANCVLSFLYDKDPIFFYLLHYNEQLSPNDSHKNNLLNLSDDEAKSIMVTETPWVREAKTESERWEELKTLFDRENRRNNKAKAIAHLRKSATADGWPWYEGMNTSESVTLYMLRNLRRLATLTGEEHPSELRACEMNAVKRLDQKMLDRFVEWQQDSTKSQIAYVKKMLESVYVRSYYDSIPLVEKNKEILDYYLNTAADNWLKLDLYERAMLAVTLSRNGRRESAGKIIQSIREYAVQDKESGMYWPDNSFRIFFISSNISRHLCLTEALLEQELSEDERALLTQRIFYQQQAGIEEPVAVITDAINTLLQLGIDRLKTVEKKTEVLVGKEEFVINNTEINRSLDYIRKVWSKESVTPEKATVKINSAGRFGSGALYWQYYETPEEVESQKGVLHIEKRLLKEVVEEGKERLLRIDTSSVLNVGDKVIIRLTVKADRDMQYVHVKDMPAACFESADPVSSLKWMDGLNVYKSSKDASCHFYMDYLPKGLYVLEYPVYVSHAGEYGDGIATVQCMYAPQFISHRAGTRVRVRE